MKKFCDPQLFQDPPPYSEENDNPLGFIVVTLVLQAFFANTVYQGVQTQKVNPQD